MVDSPDGSRRPEVNRTGNAEKAKRVRAGGVAADGIAARARRTDPDRFLCAVFSPPAVREEAFALCCFHHELERAAFGVGRRSAHGPLAAMIRLGWWREVLAGEREDWRGDALAVRVREMSDHGRVPAAVLLDMIDAYEAAAADPGDAEAGRAALIRGAGGAQVALAHLLGVSEPSELDRAAASGAAYALARRIGDGSGGSGADRTAEGYRHLGAVDGRLPGPRHRAALLPAVLAARDLQRRRPVARRGIGDLLAVAWTALRPGGHVRLGVRPVRPGGTP